MTDYISRENAIKEIERDVMGGLNYKYCLANIPAADVAPVVRCKDCELWNEWDHSGRKSLGNYRCSCAYWTVEDGPTFYTGENDFCSYAEPKEDGGEKDAID